MPPKGKSNTGVYIDLHVRATNDAKSRIASEIQSVVKEAMDAKPIVLNNFSVKLSKKWAQSTIKSISNSLNSEVIELKGISTKQISDSVRSSSSIGSTIGSDGINRVVSKIDELKNVVSQIAAKDFVVNNNIISSVSGDIEKNKMLDLYRDKAYELAASTRKARKTFIKINDSGTDSSKLSKAIIQSGQTGNLMEAENNGKFESDYKRIIGKVFKSTSIKEIGAFIYELEEYFDVYNRILKSASDIGIEFDMPDYSEYNKAADALNNYTKARTEAAKASNTTNKTAASADANNKDDKESAVDSKVEATVDTSQMTEKVRGAVDEMSGMFDELRTKIVNTFDLSGIQLDTSGIKSSLEEISSDIDSAIDNVANDVKPTSGNGAPKSKKSSNSKKSSSPSDSLQARTIALRERALKWIVDNPEGYARNAQELKSILTSLQDESSVTQEIYEKQHLELTKLTEATINLTNARNALSNSYRSNKSTTDTLRSLEKFKNNVIMSGTDWESFNGSEDIDKAIANLGKYADANSSAMAHQINKAKEVLSAAQLEYDRTIGSTVAKQEEEAWKGQVAFREAEERKRIEMERTFREQEEMNAKMEAEAEAASQRQLADFKKEEEEKERLEREATAKQESAEWDSQRAYREAEERKRIEMENDWRKDKENRAKAAAAESARDAELIKQELAMFDDSFQDEGAITNLAHNIDMLKTTLGSIPKDVLPEGTDISRLEGFLTELNSEAEMSKERFAEIKKEVDELQRKLDKTGAVDKISRDLSQYRTELTNFINQIDALLKNNSRMPESYKTNILGIRDQAQDLLNGDVEDRTAFAKLKQQAADAKRQIVSTGKAGKTMVDTMKSGFEKFNSWLLVSKASMALYNMFKKMISAVKELDAAMTELKKVTDLTDNAYENFLNKAADMARSTGATMSDTINATADFARLGYSLQDASMLAESALIYKNVGDGIGSIGDASESVISTMKAFGIEAKDAMSIVDSFNEVGNNFAISSSGIGEALQRSAAALAAAGNSIDESIGLITAMNSIVQNPEQVGTSLKTLTTYLRAAKTEAADAGIETDGMAESASKLRSELLSLSGVDIMIDSENFKSTYQIIKELASVWDTLSDVTQANILEKISGKRGANTTAALIKNFKDASAAAETSANAYGSASAENAKYMDSINGRIAVMKANFEDMSSSIINSGIIKFVVSFASGIERVVTELAKIKMLLPTIVASVIAIRGAKSGLEADKMAKSVTGLLTSSIAESADARTEFIKKYKSVLEGATNSQRKYIATQVESAVASGEFGKQIENRVKDVNAVGVAMESASSSASGLSAAASGVKTAFTKTSAIITGVMVAIGVISYAIDRYNQSIQETIDKAHEIVDAYDDVEKSYGQNVKTLKSLNEEFNALSNGVDAKGKNISLTSNEYDRYLDIVQQVIDISPNVVTAYDNEGNAVANYSSLVSDAIEKQKEFIDNEKEMLLSSGSTIFEGAKSAVSADIQDFMYTTNAAMDSVRENIEGIYYSPAFEGYIMRDSVKDAIDKFGSDFGIDNLLSLFAGKTYDASAISALMELYDKRAEFLAFISRSVEDGGLGIDSNSEAFTAIRSAIESARTFSTKLISDTEDLARYSEVFIMSSENDKWRSPLSEDEVAIFTKVVKSMCASMDVASLELGEFRNRISELGAEYAAALSNESISPVLEALDSIANASGNNVDEIEEYNKALAEFWNSFEGSENAKQMLTDLFDLLFRYSTAPRPNGVATEMSKIADATDKLSKSYDALKKAQDDMASGHGMSAETAQSIMSMLEDNEDPSDYLYVENGLLKLNESAWIARGESMSTGNLDALKKELEALKVELMVIEEENELYQSMTGGNRTDSRFSSYASERETITGNYNPIRDGVTEAKRLIIEGWDDINKEFVSLYTTQLSAGTGHGYDFEYDKNVVLTLSPILPDGTILTPDAINEYLPKLLNQAAGTVDGIINADSIDNGGMGILVDVSEVYDGASLKDIQEERAEVISHVTAESDALNASLANEAAQAALVEKIELVEALINSVVNRTGIYNELANSVDRLTSSYGLLADAERESLSANGLTSSTMKSILQLLDTEDDYSKFISFDNGAARISAEAINELRSRQIAAEIGIETGRITSMYNSRIDALKKDIYDLSESDSEAVAAKEAEIVALESQRDSAISLAQELGVLIEAELKATDASKKLSDVQDSISAASKSGDLLGNMIWGDMPVLSQIESAIELAQLLTNADGSPSDWVSWIKEIDSDKIKWDAAAIRKLSDAQVDLALSGINLGDSHDEIVRQMKDVAFESAVTKASIDRMSDAYSKASGVIENSALADGQTALSYDTYQKLIESDARFASIVEYQNGVLTINAQKYRDIADEALAETRALAVSAIAAETSNERYRRLTATTEKLTDADQKYLDEVNARIVGYRVLINEIDNATSAYTRFNNAAGSGDSERYDTLQDMLQVIKDVNENAKSDIYGMIGDERYQIAYEMLISPDIKVGTKEYEKAMKTAERYIKDGREGMVNFAKDLDKYGFVNKDGSISGTLDDIASALGIEPEFVRGLFDQLNKYMSVPITITEPDLTPMESAIQKAYENSEKYLKNGAKGLSEFYKDLVDNGYIDEATNQLTDSVDNISMGMGMSVEDINAGLNALEKYGVGVSRIGDDIDSGLSYEEVLARLETLTQEIDKLTPIKIAFDVDDESKNAAIADINEVANTVSGNGSVDGANGNTGTGAGINANIMVSVDDTSVSTANTTISELGKDITPVIKPSVDPEYLNNTNADLDGITSDKDVVIKPIADSEYVSKADTDMSGIRSDSDVSIKPIADQTYISNAQVDMNGVTSDHDVSIRPSADSAYVASTQTDMSGITSDKEISIRPSADPVYISNASIDMSGVTSDKDIYIKPSADTESVNKTKTDMSDVMSDKDVSIKPSADSEYVSKSETDMSDIRSDSDVSIKPSVVPEYLSNAEIAMSGISSDKDIHIKPSIDIDAYSKVKSDIEDLVKPETKKISLSYDGDKQHLESEPKNTPVGKYVLNDNGEPVLKYDYKAPISDEEIISLNNKGQVPVFDSTSGTYHTVDRKSFYRAEYERWGFADEDISNNSSYEEPVVSIGVSVDEESIDNTMNEIGGYISSSEVDFDINISSDATNKVISSFESIYKYAEESGLTLDESFVNLRNAYGKVLRGFLDLNKLTPDDEGYSDNIKEAAASLSQSLLAYYKSLNTFSKSNGLDQYGAEVDNITGTFDEYGNLEINIDVASAIDSMGEVVDGGNEIISKVSEVDDIDLNIGVKTALTNMQLVIGRVNSVIDAINKIPTSKTTTIYVKNANSSTDDSQGNAMAGGNAYGMRATSFPGGRTLTGEEGTEIVVDPSSNSWYTVGDNGAEFRYLPRGAIVFNARQTKELLTNGRTSGRGNAMATGNAAANILSAAKNKLESNPLYKAAVKNSKKSDKKSDDVDGGAIYEFLNSNKKKKSGGKGSSGIDKLAEQYEKLNKQLEHLIAHQEFLYRQSERGLDFTGMSNSLEEQVRLYKQHIVDSQDTINKMIAAGAKDTDEAFQKVEESYWSACDSLYETLDKINNLYLDALNEKIDGIQSSFDNLKTAANEFNDYNSITVDTFQSLVENGLQYMNFLEEVEGVYQINKDAINDMILAEKEQLSVETAISYITKLNNALSDKQTNLIDNLVDLTNGISTSTWDAVYAQAAMLKNLGLTEEQYNKVIENVNRFRSISMHVITDIANGTTEMLDDQRDAMEKILDLTMDLVKAETEDKIDALNDEIDAYKEIIDLKKKSLEKSKDESDYAKDVADKVKEIAKAQANIDKLKLDDSRAARAERAKLEEDMKKLQDELSELQDSHAYDAQMKSLDDAAEAYEKSKNDEIEVLNESISSKEKLYRKAIERINTEWESLYQDLITWNTDTGSSLNSEITENWNLATKAVERYGSAIEALKKMNISSDADGNKDNVAVAPSGNFAEDIARATESINNGITSGSGEGSSESEDKSGRIKVVASGKWPLYKSATGSNYDKTASGGDELIYVGTKDTSSRYHVLVNGKDVFIQKKNKSGSKVVSELINIPKYHNGGIVGDSGEINDKEVLAILKKGESVITEPQRKTLYKVIDFQKMLSEKLGTAIRSLSAPYMQAMPALASVSSSMRGTIDVGHINYSPSISVEINHNGSMTDYDAAKYGRKIAETAMDELYEGFQRRGIGGLFGSKLKQ